MTWKKSFFKITLHDIRKRSWCMALLFIVQFFAIPVSALLSIQNNQGLYGNDLNPASQYWKMIEDLFERSVFDFGKITSILFLIIGAVVMAMTGFSYLNSKKKVDFIHSMPVKRESLFLSRYAAGLFLYMVPLIVNVGIGLLAAIMAKGCSLYVLKNALCFLLYHLIYFLLFYSTSILAIVLIGNLVVSFLGIGVLFTYQTVMWFIVVNLKENFYQTYMRMYQTFRVYDPVGLLIRQIMSFNSSYFTYDYNANRVRVGTESYYSTGFAVCLIAFVLAVLIGAAALLLFRIRKSEAAGKSLVFPKSEPVAKAALLLPAGIIGGMVFYSIAVGYRKLWYMFGAVIFFLLTALVIEIIFRQDFKSLLKHKISALAGAGLILIVTLCFWLDFFGFDSRIPKTSQIESVGVSIPKIDEGQSKYYATNGEMEYYSSSYESYRVNSYFSSLFITKGEAENAVLYNCRITGEEEIEKVRELAGYYVKNKSKVKGLELSGFSNDPNWTYVMLADSQKAAEGEEKAHTQYVEYQVVYRLKNGKNVYRSYWAPYGEDFLEVMEPVYANEEYKKISAPVFQDEKNYRYLITQGDFWKKRIQIAQSSKKEILECLKKDRNKLTFQDTWTQNRRGYFYMENTFGSKSSVYCYVYEGYANTLNWLEEHGAGLEADLSEVEIVSGSVEYIMDDGSYKAFNLEDEQEKAEIIPYLIRSEFIAPGEQINIVSSMLAMIEYTVTQESRQTINERNYFQDGSADDKQMFSFYLKEVPPFLKEKLNYSKRNK